MRDLAEVRAKVNGLRADRAAATAALRDAKTDAQGATAHYNAATAARDAAQSLAATVQQRAHAHIAGIVGRCLAAVFDDPYTFHIEFVEKRGKTEAELMFMRNGNRLDPLTAAGGGPCAVAALGLRVASVVLRRPPGRRLLVLDEPLRGLKPVELYGPRVMAMLDMLAAELDLQIIMVPHDNLPSLQTGTIVRIG